MTAIEFIGYVYLVGVSFSVMIAFEDNYIDDVYKISVFILITAPIYSILLILSFPVYLLSELRNKWDDFNYDTSDQEDLLDL